MSVLVGIVSKNRAAILPTAIESAMKQSYPELQIAVYDDNSSDNTRELESKYTNISWEFGTQNHGYVYARNKFMSNTDAKYFCSLDDDSWFMKADTLAKGIDYLDKNPQVAAVAFDILSPDRPNEAKEDQPVEVNSYIGCGHIVRVSNAREVGLYDPPPSYYGGEEKDLCIQLINRGYSIMLLPGVHVWHDKTNVARDIPAQHRSGVCNDLVFTWRRTPFILLLPVFMAKLARHTWFSIRYQGGILLNACIKGFVDFFKVLLGAKVHRRPVSLKAFKRFHSVHKI